MGSGQPYYFKNYQVSNGLASNTITSILQDSKGFIWLGTRNGLNRFDGTAFKTFRNDKNDPASLGSNSVLSLSEDSSQCLWVGTYKGIYRYDPRLETFSLFRQVPAGETRYLLRDRNNNTWISSNFSLYRYDHRKGALISYPQDSNEIASMALGEDSSLWIATRYGAIKKYDPHADDFIAYELTALTPGRRLSTIQDLYPAGDSTVLIGTMDQVLLFNPATKQLQDLFSGLTGQARVQVHKILRQSAHEYWIGTETGLYILDMQERKVRLIQKQYANPYAITDNVIYSFCKDREGGTWVGTFFGGVNYFAPPLNQFRKYFPEPSTNSLSGNLVHEICGDQYGHIWIGTEDAGLNRLDPRTGHIQQFKPDGRKGSIAYQNIHGLATVGNELWIGTYEHGLDVMDIRSGKVIRHYESNQQPGCLRGNFVVSLYKTRSNELLAGTWNGLSRYDRTHDRFIDDPFFNMQVQAMHEAADGTLWVASYGSGVYYHNPHTGAKGNFRFDPADAGSLPNNYVNNLFEDSRGDLWFCTEAGLSKYNKSTGKMIRYGVDSGLPEHQVFRIQEDRSGKLWISTSKGLYQYDPASSKTEIYTTVDGLLSEQFNYNSAWRSPEGSLYFGTVKGMVSFDPAGFTEAPFVAPVYITGLQVNNRELWRSKHTSPAGSSLLYAQQLVLTHDSSNLSFDVAALSYITPEANEYSYMMEGLDKEWTLIRNNRKIFYTKLPPGHYTFRVRGGRNGADQQQQEAALRIIVLPPWWASPWAYALYTLAAAGILLTIFRYYHLALREKNKRKIETLEIEKEREIYNAKIEFFTNVAHEIRTPLTLIKLPLDKLLQQINGQSPFTESLHLMKKNTHRLIELTDQLLDFRKAEANKFTLSFVRTDITDLLKELLVGFKPAADQKQLTLRLEVPRLPLQASVDPEAFRKILSNLFNNAIKYADSLVIVRLLPFNSDATVFQIEVRNDGYLIPMELKEKIFEPFYRLKETEKQAGTGIGLPLARSLAELHKGVLDLRAPENNMNIFQLSVPIHQENEIDLQGYETIEMSAAAPGEDPEPADPEKQQVLLVEDQKEILQFIQKELKQHYTIFRAYNGQEALDILEKENIQLVVSDIMMPVMDGIELCKRIKTDLQYSHIPIILLTAKNTLHARIEGLEVGADAYIEKPFSLEHLQAQINNLLASRQNLKTYFTQSPLAHIRGMAISKTDSSFLEALQKVILDNITDMDLDVDKLSKMMNMSRASFYRKIKALSDLTPNELINISRLKKAAELLSAGSYKINEVASMVGYSLTSNFSRDFHKQFGVTPSSYVMGLKEK